MQPTSITFAADKLPETLKRLRQHAGLSQRQVAKALGVSSAATISHWENGKRSINLSLLIALVELYGYRVDFKLGAIQEMER